MNRKTVAYLRVSTEAQTEKYGLELQREGIEQKARFDGITIEDWYVDGGYSGATLNRPEMQRLIADVKSEKIGKVYVFRLDRLSRDSVDALTLLKRTFPQHNVQVVSASENVANETPDDRFMLGIHAEFAEHERAVFFQRTRAGRVERAKKGLWGAGATVPYGYCYDRNDGTLHPIPEQAEKVRKVFDMYIAGASCERIRKTLGLHSETLVRNILKRKTYTGKVMYLGACYDGLHEPLITAEIFERAQDAIADRKGKPFIHNGNLLSGLCCCGKCGSRMRYQLWGNGGQKLVCYAKYPSSKSCLKRTERCDGMAWATPVENEVERCFKEFAVSAAEVPERESSEGFLKAEISKANKKLQNLYGLYGDAPNDNLLAVIQDETDRVKALQEELDAEHKTARFPNEVRELTHVADVWDELDVHEKNKVLRRCVGKVVVTNDDVRIYFNL